ncbi:MAG: AMP phosphorylase [Candidatus ainarchaeum sp.]|nr:AMP phosphorylase [Candidatus ainarchaeum sp.]
MSDYSKDLKVKIFGITTGKSICILNKIDAKDFGLFTGDRVELYNKRSKKRAVGVIDITANELKSGQIGLFEDIAATLSAKEKDLIDTKVTKSLKSLDFIKKKMDGKKLTNEEVVEIVKDITDDRLTDVEASAFIAAIYMKGLDLDETVYMTKALINNGNKISFDVTPVVDKHSVGGVNGRATMVIIPIIASAGLYMPKTSSRSITSSAGTADAMEVLAPVDLDFNKIKEITKKVGGVIAWGGAVDLAPADDKIIKLEHPLSLDPEGQVIASVLAKKASVGSKYVVIDLPVGPQVKIKDQKTALRMAEKFVHVGKEIGMEVDAVITDGTEPSGLAFGPALEAKYALEILEGKRFDNLAQKSCECAGAVLELAKKVKVGKGYEAARVILESGKALAKMKEIIKAQGGKIFSSEDIKLAKYKKEIFAKENGVIQEFNIKLLTKAARLAGAPADKTAGILLSKTVGEKIGRNELLLTIYAENKQKLEVATEFIEQNCPVTFKKIIIQTIRD